MNVLVSIVEWKVGTLVHRAALWNICLPRTKSPNMRGLELDWQSHYTHTITRIGAHNVASISIKSERTLKSN